MKIHKSGDLFYLPDLSEVLPVRCLPVSLDATLWYEEGAAAAVAEFEEERCPARTAQIAGNGVERADTRLAIAIVHTPQQALDGVDGDQLPGPQFDLLDQCIDAGVGGLSEDESRLFFKLVDDNRR